MCNMWNKVLTFANYYNCYNTIKRDQGKKCDI